MAQAPTQMTEDRVPNREPRQRDGKQLLPYEGERPNKLARGSRVARYVAVAGMIVLACLPWLQRLSAGEAPIRGPWTVVFIAAIVLWLALLVALVMVIAHARDHHVRLPVWVYVTAVFEVGLCVVVGIGMSLALGWIRLRW